MALKFGNFIFYHIGRTAGYWVRDNINQLYGDVAEVGEFHCSPQEVSDEQKKGLTSFTLVRHPLEWLRSFWLHDVVNGTPPGYGEALLSKSFEEFLIGVLDYSKKNNGFVSNVFSPYVNNVELVYRSEDLPAPILELIGTRDPSISMEGFEFSRKVNEGTVFDLGEYSKASENVLAEILNIELPFFSKFGYVDIPQKMIGTVNGHSKIFLPVTAKKDAFEASGIRPIYPRYFNDSPRPTNGHLAIKDFHQISYALQGMDLAGKAMLDIGAADCGISELMISAGAKSVLGFDLKFSDEIRNYIASSYSDVVQLVEGGFYQLSECIPQKMDCAISINLFHNLFHPEKFLLEVYKVLGDEGSFFVHVPLWEDVVVKSDGPVWIGFGENKSILQYPCTGLYNEAGVVDLFASCGFGLVKKEYEYNFGPCAGYSSPEIDGSRFGPVKLCGLIFKKTHLNHRVENWDANGAYLGLPASGFDRSDLSRLAQDLLARNGRLSTDAKNLMLDIGAREGVISSLRGELIELTQVIDELRAAVTIAKGEAPGG
ncbi:class I SAM-dependent methyltransferase [Paraburkholderia sediminicola]|uniref:class I SAM-dependent methyltransferase n=1 Tax=Paraburkholderia sediminicola TaxID=458836 RepID=UPI0038B87911